MKKIIPYFFLIIPLFTSGCFTAMDQIGDGPGHIRANTVALDVVTLPVQAAAAVVAAPIYGIVVLDDNHKEKQVAKENNRLMSLLEKDPRTGLTERWDQPHDRLSYEDDQRRIIFAQSFSNPNVKYSDDLLEEIYKTCPSLHDYVFRCQGCSKEFLTKHFEEKFQQSQKPASQSELLAIMSNPNTPIELVEKVATAKDYPINISRGAKQILAKRRSELAMPTTSK
jgi:hypothetical protein